LRLHVQAEDGGIVAVGVEIQHRRGRGAAATGALARRLELPLEIADGLLVALDLPPVRLPRALAQLVEVAADVVEDALAPEDQALDGGGVARAGREEVPVDDVGIAERLDGLASGPPEAAVLAGAAGDP